jgi:hypothetical protein
MRKSLMSIFVFRLLNNLNNVTVFDDMVIGPALNVLRRIYASPFQSCTSYVTHKTQMKRRVDLVRTDVSEERIAAVIRVIIIGELGTLAVTSNRSTLRRNTKLLLMFLTRRFLSL